MLEEVPDRMDRTYASGGHEEKVKQISFYSIVVTEWKFFDKLV